MSPAFQLRPAAGDDMEFLFHLLAVALGPHVERAFGRWDEDEQRTRFFATTDPATHEIVLVDDAPVGCLKVALRHDEIALHRVFVLPSHQGRGLGTELVRGVLAEGRRRGLPVRLRVFHVNPARRLYARLGFVVTGETDTHVHMEKPPG